MALFYLRISNIIPDYTKLRVFQYRFSLQYLEHNSCGGL
jgi:hypothetical protein